MRFYASSWFMGRYLLSSRHSYLCSINDGHLCRADVNKLTAQPAQYIRMHLNEHWFRYKYNGRCIYYWWKGVNKRL